MAQRISRRQFLKSLGALGALGLAAVPYGLFEPLLRLRVARYRLHPRGWPDGVPTELTL